MDNLGVVYLAPRHSRRTEMEAYIADLKEHGLQVYAGWITNPYPASETSLLTTPAVASYLALADMQEIGRADTVFVFSEPPGVRPNRGGRHVEFGYALGLGKRIIVIGPRENVFHCLSGIYLYADWPEFTRTWL